MLLRKELLKILLFELGNFKESVQLLKEIYTKKSDGIYKTVSCG